MALSLDRTTLRFRVFDGRLCLSNVLLQLDLLRFALPTGLLELIGLRP
jgi:hypothetical protein